MCLKDVLELQEYRVSSKKMMNSISYYFVSAVIKLKGIKKIFSKAPINYHKLRKDDIHSPSAGDVFGLNFTTIKIGKTNVIQILPKEVKSKNAILYCHGGASVYGPSDLHWNSIARIVEKTRTIAYLVDYPKSPEYQIGEINTNVDMAYAYLLTKVDAKNLILLGDSMGGTLLTLLVQRLIERNLHLPKCIFLISPVMDCSFTNPAIELIEKKDIMLSKVGVLSAKRMCAGDLDLRSREISPLYGHIKGFIFTYIFIAENDIMRPDEEVFVEMLQRENVQVEVVIGKAMPHVWPFLPMMSESKIAIKQIINRINSFA